MNGFRSELVPSEPPPILVAALRSKMLRLAGTEGDGAILNWLSPGDMPKITEAVGPGKEIMCRMFVYPTEDYELVRKLATRHMNAYLNVPVYRAFQEWLGRTEVLTPMWDAWAEGDRKKATEVIPDELIDELVVWGSAERIRAGVEKYVEMGVTTPTPLVMTSDVEGLRIAIDCCRLRSSKPGCLAAGRPSRARVRSHRLPTGGVFPAAGAFAAARSPEGTTLSTWAAVETHDFQAALVAGLERAFPKDPPTFIVSVPHGYADVDVVVTDLHAGGLDCVAVESVTLEGRAASAADVAAGYCTGTPLRSEIEARGDLTVTTAIVAKEMEARLGAGTVTGWMSAHVIEATPAL